MEAPSANTQALPAGTRIEEFMIERVLGSGGFGITYLARDVSLNRQVVIKENLPAQFAWRETASGTVRPRHSSGGDADDFQWSMNNFLREAETLASLDHPGIVRVLRKFEANGTAYFVMPFVEGVALDELAAQRQGKPFSEEELRGLLERVLSALAYLHERGIYHRDIKPGNLLISTEGVPALIDFGSARQRLSERSMTVIESPGYTPFEQHESRGNVGPWSDLYALGATLEKAITGEVPPKAMDRMRNDPRVPLASRAGLKALYSPAFLASIDKALAVEETRRWQHAGEWQAALRGKLVAQAPVVAAQKHKPMAIPTAKVPGSVTQSDKKTTYVPWIVGGCVVLGLIAVANLTGEKEEFITATLVDEAAFQQERDRAEAADAQAREAEQRATQLEREKQLLIAQAKAKEEADAKEAERQRAAQAEREKQALIAQARAKEKAEKQRAAPAAQVERLPATEVLIMQESIRDGQIEEFKFEQVLDWKAGEKETVGGQTFQTGLVSYKAETIFGVKTIQAKALIQNGKVVRWIWPKSGMAIQ